MTLTIVVITYNLDSRIFLLQMEAIKKFCKDDYVVEIIDNSSIEEMAEAIRYHSMQQGISYIKTHSSVQNGSESHAFASRLSWERFKNNGSRWYFYLDHDCIPIKPFSVEEILGADKVFAGMGQGKNGKTYFWAGLVFFDSTKVDKSLIDLSPNPQFGLDTGGNLYMAIDAVGKDNCVFFDEAYYENAFFKGRAYTHFAMINKGMFIHCIAASNWVKIEDHEERISSLVNIIRGKIDSNVA